jgi:hypothetical protein
MSNGPTVEASIVDSLGRRISRQVAEILETLRSRVRSGLIAAEIWDLFTDSERDHLGGDLQASWKRLGTVGMWMEARGGSLEQALVSVALAMELVNDRELRKLKRDLELDVEINDRVAPTEVAQPTWDSQNGELRFGDRVIRKTRVLRNPSNLQRIVEAFHVAGWPIRIDNPLSLGQEQLHQALRSLNKGLDAIRFRAQEGGRAIVWERC